MSTRVLRILVVEDHDDTRQVLGMFLQILGHHSEMASEARGALEMAAGTSFDVLLTDIQMPGMNGWELLQTLRLRGHLPALVISMSAGVLEDEGGRSREFGCHTHLLKPFKVQELESALAAA